MKGFVRNEDIEIRAEQVISTYERIAGQIPTPPVPIEKVVLQVCKLGIDWDDIDEEDGIMVLGGLSSRNKVIVLNEKRRDLFEKTPGLERSTIGHEAGHWEFHIDKSGVDHPFLPGFEPRDVFMRRTSKKYGELSVFRGDIKSARKGTAAHTPLKKHDDPDEARIVNRFAAALSMPRYLIREYVKGKDLTNWPILYRLAEAFDVSPTAMRVRLEQLNYIYVDGKQIHRNKLEAHGQGTLGL